MITIKNIFQGVISCLLSVLLFTAVGFTQSSLKQVNIDLELLDYEHLRHNDKNIYINGMLHPYLKNLNPLELNTKPGKGYLGDNIILMKKTGKRDTSYGSNSINIRIEVIGADPNTYTHLADLYSIDKNYVFYNDTLITGSYSTSFSYLGLGFAKDKDQVYINGSLLTGADSESFDLVQIARDLKDIDDVYEMYPKINELDTLLIVAEDKNNEYDRYSNIIDQTALEKIQKEEKILYGKWQGIYKMQYPGESVIVDFGSNNKVAGRGCNIDAGNTYYLLSYNIIHIGHKGGMTQKGCPFPGLLDDVLGTYVIEFINDTEFVLKSLKTNEIQFVFKKENGIDTTTRHFKNITKYIPYIPYIIKSIFKKNPNLIYFVVGALGIGIYYLIRYVYRKRVSKKI